MALWSCKNEGEVNPKEVATPLEKLEGDRGVVNGMLAFKSMDVYEEHLNEMKSIPEGVSEATHLDNLEKSLSFYSKRRSVMQAVSSGARVAAVLEEEGIVDERLASILNKDNMVQIEKWIFKLDLVDKKCFVLPVEKATSQLVEEMKSNNPSSKVIQVYSTEEDVLSLLDEGKPSTLKGARTTGLFGNDAKLDYFVYYEQSSGLLYDNDDRGKIEVKVVYQKAVFYFSLQAKIKYHAKTVGGLYIETQAPLSIDYEVIRFDSKKRRSSEQDQSDRPTDSGFRSEVSYRPYESNRGLDKYWYQATFMIGGSNFTVFVRNFGIKDGY